MTGILDRLFCAVFGTPLVRRILWVVVPMAALVLMALSTESWDPPVSFRDESTGSPELRRLKTENDKLKASIDNLQPKGVHILIDTAKNRLYVKQGRALILDAVCSTGNGKILNDTEKKRRWQFDTPRGVHRVIKRVNEPVWTKPDWAFIEEGERVPHSFRERIEEEMLGDYAMHIGNSYMIHGTLYRRLLGRSVTHGCVRLGDADLEKAYKSSALGTTVIIY